MNSEVEIIYSSGCKDTSGKETQAVFLKPDFWLKWNLVVTKESPQKLQTKSQIILYDIHPQHHKYKKYIISC